MATLTQRGLTYYRRKARDDARRVAQRYAGKVLRTAQRNIRRNSYRSGELHDSGSVQPEGETWAVGFSAPHSDFVEFGTGQRGAESGVDVPPEWSYGEAPGMEPRPYLAPAFLEHLDGLQYALAETLEREADSGDE